MRIGIDARFYGPFGKGLGRYVQKLIEHLENIDTKNTYVIFLRKENFDAYQPQNPNFTKVLADVSWYSWKEQFIMPLLLHRQRLELVHFPHFNVPLLYFGKFVITLHDLILLRYPTVRATTRVHAYYWFKFLVYKLLLQNILFRAKKIIAVSDFTKKDIQKVFPMISDEKIIVTYQSNSVFLSDTLFSEDLNEKVLQKHGILKPYALYVGNAYPHKNLQRFIQAFKKAHTKRFSLVLVGKKDAFYQELIQYVRENHIPHVIFAGYVSDEDLESVYRESFLYIFPSLYEGFGLPPLEAMARGVPVISSDTSSMPEILENAAMYFDPHDTNDMASKLEAMLQDESLRKTYRNKGYQQVKKYSWKKMAQKTKSIYESMYKA